MKSRFLSFRLALETLILLLAVPLLMALRFRSDSLHSVFQGRMPREPWRYGLFLIPAAFLAGLWLAHLLSHWP